MQLGCRARRWMLSNDAHPEPSQPQAVQPEVQGSVLGQMLDHPTHISFWVACPWRIVLHNRDKLAPFEGPNGRA